MITQELMGILVCPETKQPVHLADEATVSKMNELIRSGTLLNRAGVAVSEPVDAALVRQDGAFAYVIREDIPTMLVDEAIRLPLG